MHEALLDPIRLATELLGAAVRRGEAPSNGHAAAAAAAAADTGAAPDDLAPGLLAALRQPRLVRAAEVYGLAPVHQAILVAALAPEVDARIGRIYAALNARAGEPRATVGLLDDLLAVLGLGRGAATAALRDDGWMHWGLVEVGTDAPASWQPVVLARDVVALLRDPEDPWPPPAPAMLDRTVMTPATRDRAERAATRLTDPAARLVVHGSRGRGRGAIAAAVLGAAGWPAAVAGPDDDVDVVRRAAAWHRGAVIVDVAQPPARWRDLVRRVATPVALVAERAGDALAAVPAGRALAEVAVDEPGVAERVALWRRALEDAAADPLDPAELDGVATLARDPARITTAAALARTRAVAGGGRVDRTALAAACRDLSTASFGDLAHDVPADAAPDDLVVSAATRRELDLMVAWATHRDVVLATQPRAALFPAGLACLFHGPSGTGKTLAARVIAARLAQRLIRIDLAHVVNKYIGETEKQLDRLFTLAAGDHVILFFDEADALFSRRTEVRDAHDRYANLETGFLLQRIESHPGISILATNLRAGLDPAFTRRLHVVAAFTAPEADERAAIWQRHLPERRAADVDIALLAHGFALTGGAIRNVCFAAMVLAAAERRPLAMHDLVVALCREQVAAGVLIDARAFGRWASAAVAWVRPVTP